VQLGFHREKAPLALLISACGSALSLIPVLVFLQAVLIKVLHQLKIKSVLSQGYLLQLLVQVLLAVGVYGRSTWEWVA